MRTIVDLPEDQVKALDSLGKTQDLSRAELVRRAVASYLDAERKAAATENLDQYYGFLDDAPGAFDGLDSVDYQRKIRGEWDERDKSYGRWGMHEPATPDMQRPSPEVRAAAHEFIKNRPNKEKNKD